MPPSRTARAPSASTPYGLTRALLAGLYMGKQGALQAINTTRAVAN